MRSKLFVPASRPELFAKAMASAADAVAVDLEDAVPQAHKATARLALVAWLRSLPGSGCALALALGPEPRPSLMVRCHAPGTAAFEDDMTALAQAPLAPLAMINLAKVEDGGQVRLAAERLAAIEAAQSLATPLRLLVTIETPRALRRAAELAAAHPRVAGLQLGLADLFEPAGIDRSDRAAVHSVMLAVRLAAAEAGCFALDAAFTEVADIAGLQAEARMARRLGYAGKSCIHPSQIAAVNAVFTPDAAALDRARRLISQAEAAAVQGIGALVLDGQMVDAAHVQAARNLLARHGQG